MADKKSYDGAERRKFKRKKVEFTVTCLVKQPVEVAMRVGGKKVEAQMLDLSEGGMAVKSEHDLPLDAQLAIDFVLLYAFTTYENIMQAMQIEGAVVNRVALDDKTFRLGIHFTKVTPEDSKAISDFVAHLSKG